MLGKLFKKPAGRDDLERIAYKENLDQLNAYLKTRKVLIPRRPIRFLDAGNFTQEQLLEQIKKDAEDLSATPFEPWILKVDGKKRLPAFSSQERAQDFAGVISQKLNKVFSLGSTEVLLQDIIKNLDIDFVDLNLFGQKSWEIGVKRPGA